MELDFDFESAPILPQTCLRATYEHVRGLSLADQVADCVDLVTHPEVLVEEMRDAFDAVTIAFASHDGPTPVPEWARAGEVEAYERGARAPLFYPGRDVAVIGARRAFTCLAVDLDPLSGFPIEGAGEGGGLDFIGLTCDETATPVLGGVQSPRETSAYPVFLRLLAALTEMAPEKQLRRLNEPCFRGTLPERPSFDLSLVLWDEPEASERVPLAQLTRDLAERVKAAARTRSHGSLLRDIVCLRMNPDRFDGRLRYEWHV
jgi:hypothetical protein